MIPQAWRQSGRFFRHGEHQIFFHEAGSGPTVLLIHGFPTSSWDWHRIWEPLSEHYRLIAADMIGFGLSDKPAPYRYSIFDQADLQETLLTQLGIERCHILAHDYGDTVAQEMLARYAERRARGAKSLILDSICFTNGGLFPEAQRPLRIQKLLAGPLGGLLARALGRSAFNRSMRRIFAPHTYPSDEELSAHWSLLQHNGGRQVIHRVIRYLHERKKHRQRWVEPLQYPIIPLCFLVGSLDPISGHWMARRYCELVPRPDVVELAGVGHYPALEAPRNVVSSYREFVETRTTI